MKGVDPRLAKAERLLTKVLQLFAEIKAGVPAPRRARRKRRARYRRPDILKALREGASLRAKGDERDPRLPCPATLARYRRTSPKFDAQAREILAGRPRAARKPRRTSKPRPLPGAGLDWEVIAQRIENGESIGDKNVHRDGLPSRWLIKARRKADPDFAARVDPVLGARKKKRGVPSGPNVDWAAALREIAAGASVNRFARNRGSLPSDYLLQAKARTDPVFAAAYKKAIAERGHPRTQRGFDLALILEKLADGVRVDVMPPEPGMPSWKVLWRMRRASPAVNKAVVEARAEGKRRKANKSKLSKLGRDAPWRLAQAAVPRTLPDDIRDDVVSELSLMLLSGRASPDGDLTAAWKQCRSKLTAPRWRETSLDAPLPGTDRLTRLDLLAEDAERF